MIVARLKLWYLVFLLFVTIPSYATPSMYLDEGRAKVVMRQIGHELLLQNGDSTSLVLPILKEDNKYTIRFQNQFDFVPDSLVNIVKDVVDQVDLSQNLLVEVLTCDSNLVVYSFEYSPFNDDGLYPCQGRAHLEGCYQIQVAVVANNNPYLFETRLQPLDEVNSEKGFLSILFSKEVMSLLVIIFIVSVVFYKRKSKSGAEHILQVGSYGFDFRNYTLTREGKEIGLTSKEADLLFLLHSKSNTTVDRQDILKQVWGDEGAYVGRTLDVFISKLRKKLEADNSIKIINVRGVGYKFILDD